MAVHGAQTLVIKLRKRNRPSVMKSKCLVLYCALHVIAEIARWIVRTSDLVHVSYIACLVTALCACELNFFIPRWSFLALECQYGGRRLREGCSTEKKNRWLLECTQCVCEIVEMCF